MTPRNSAAYRAKNRARILAYHAAYHSKAKTRPIPPELLDEALADFVADPQTGCFISGATLDPLGYPVPSIGGLQVKLHRQALARKLGRPIVPGMQACHSCDVPSCIRPEHLWEGTQKDNIRDAASKGRLATGERNGSAKRRLVAAGVNEAPAFGA